ncbi:DUF3502 domain-containing protein [Paenibacillus contaminans]|uniref:ABC transporter substrate-binding protein n=1 Tax=Paenibacillus contaminans TaxID=450362 RepID=A0A329M3Q9_9BACL|nr:DUF3502 domain-containing protein [Paenibacillus contaminans]RAV14825.1 hypothetical protein DQG23_30810 [Paenibacillus contaminans]
MSLKTHTFKKKHVRGSVFALACLLLLSACGGESGGTSPEPSSPSASSEKKEPLKISIIAYPANGLMPLDGTKTQKMLEERFHVKFEVLPVDGSQPEKFNLYWAQGGKADVIMAFGGNYTALIDQGMFREISTEQLYKKMPVWMQKVESLVGDPALVKKLMLYKDKQYAIPFTHGPLMESGIMIARKDWMNKVGISKQPESLAEFEALLKAFTENDPDGNNKKDTYGIHGGQRYNFNYVWGAFGLMPNTFTQRDGKIAYTSVLPQYKEALKLLQKWYKAGYIDPEFVTDDRTQQRNKWSEGKFGILADNGFWMDSARGENGVLKMLEMKNSAAQFQFMSPFQGPDGSKGSFVDFPSITGDGAIYFGKGASDEIVAKMMEIKEALASDWGLYKEAYFGTEGTDYTIDANGKLKISPDLNSEKINKAGIAQTFGLMPITMDWMKNTMNERDEIVHRQGLEQPKVFNGMDFAVSQVNKAQEKKGADVLKIVDEYYINAITGKADIDGTWDKYVENANKAGLSDILAEFQTLYKDNK